MSPAEQEELRQAMQAEPPEGGLWNGPKVPETADKLRAIARVLNAGEGAVFLGN